MALDFIGPLHKDSGYNCIFIMTDHLGLDYKLIPTRMDASAEDIALLVFNSWYCENGLPDNFVSDRDKLFALHFGKALPTSLSYPSKCHPYITLKLMAPASGLTKPSTTNY